jgi:hypothetical protein
MKYLLPVSIMLVLAFSCNNKAEQSDSQIEAKVDSMVGERIMEINRRAMEDLDQRMTIEVKEKADSIIMARRAAASADTAPAPQHPLP